MLHVHRAQRADGLVPPLAQVLAQPLDDVMAREVIAVPAKGVERWLMQRLSHQLGAKPGRADGVCANVEFPTPSRLVADALAAVTQIDAADDPWLPKALVWSLLDVIDACLGEPWFAALGRYLGADTALTDHRRRRRLASASHLARLFDEYAANRPAMIRDWCSGIDTDGAGKPLSDDLRWQAELWRRVRRHLGAASPAERLQPAVDLLSSEPDVVDYPPRLSIFGPTRLTAAQLDVIAALAEHRDVHLWIPHPSPVLWDNLAALTTDDRPARRADDPSLDAARNPLLASLGRDVRELQRRLGHRRRFDHLHPVDESPLTLLGHLQRSIASDQHADVPPSQMFIPEVSDTSLQVHACHGRARQVEVMREVLVGLLQSDPTLEPRDVIVMCPDVETYAPLISATFGVDDDDADRHPGHQLRVRLADRSAGRVNPLLSTLTQLLDLAGRRITASEVLDLAASPPVRARFRYDDDELERLRGWVAAANIRWGLDAEHREPWSLGFLPQNTWRAGLDRILLGAAMSEDDLRFVGTCLPLDDVGSDDVDLAGRFAELVERLRRTLDAMQGEHPLEHWISTLRDGLQMLTDVTDRDVWQWVQVDAELADLTTRAAAVSSALIVTDLATLLDDDLAARPTRANFRTGSLTVASMVPMRSVPHRVVCLLGLDDGAFPRNIAVDGDNVLARDPCVGERDARSEDRQLLLDAVMAAREILVIVYSGADPRNNARRPPAVPVGELLDAVRRIATTADPAQDIAERIVSRHPLQPFDARNFSPDALIPQRVFSFDRHSLHAAEIAARQRRSPDVLVPAPLPAMATTEVELAQLVYFLENPVKAFVRQRLDVTVLGDEDEIADDLTVGLDGLAKWAVGDRLLDARLRGASAAAARGAEWRRGTLPPGELGHQALRDVEPAVDALLSAARRVLVDEPRQLDVDARLDGRTVTGTVSGVRGHRIVRVEYSRLGPRHRLRAWAQLLALTVSYPDREWTAVTIGRGGGDDAAGSTLGPVDAGEARLHLAGLVQLRDLGMREPLPLAVKTSHAYAVARASGSDHTRATEAADKEWRDTPSFTTDELYPGEQSDLAHQLAFNGVVDLTVFLDQPTPSDDDVLGPPFDETHRFGSLARRLWEPLLRNERAGL